MSTSNGENQYEVFDQNKQTNNQTRGLARAMIDGQLSSISDVPVKGKGRRWRSGGKKRKRRAGVRKKMLKNERLAKSHLRVVY